MIDDKNKYRICSIIIFIMSTIPIGFGKSLLTISLSIILMIIGFLISRKYKCPHCGFVFDIRVPSRKIYNCQKCGKPL